MDISEDIVEGWKKHACKLKEDREARKYGRYKEPFDRYAPRVLVTYFVQREITGLVKIGNTLNMPTRLRALQCGSPDILRVLRTVRGNRESEFHERFSHLRMHGEWFKASSELLEFIKSC